MSEQQTEIVRRQPLAQREIWRPWAPLRGVMDELFSEWPAEARRSGIMPAVDITESEEAYKVHAELPGVAKADVTVELEDNVLCIRGEKKSRRDEKLERGRRLECMHGAFSRSFALPQDADTERVSAEFKDGVLEVSVAKRPESKPRQIAVKE